MSYSGFLGVIALLPVDFGEGVWKFLLQIIERVILMNGYSAPVKMDRKGKYIVYPKMRK